MNNVCKVWGILNVTPDSFSDGGNNFHHDAALAAALKLMNDGADVLDIGAQSTRPGAALISAEEEWDRIKDILPIIATEAKTRNVLISLDSSKGVVIQRALEYIDIINDVSALADPLLVAIVRESKLPCVLMHHLTIPADREIVLSYHLDILEPILRWFERKLTLLEDLGIRKDRLILDPGIGFGKTSLQSMEILGRLSRLKQFGLPLLIAHSRKRFLLEAFKAVTTDELDAATAMVSWQLLESNIQHLRVHDAWMHRKFVDLYKTV